MSQLVPPVDLRRYPRAVALTSQAYAPSSSRTRSGRAYHPRGFPTVPTPPLYNHSESFMLFTDGDDPVPTSSAPQIGPTLISIPTTAVVSYTVTSDTPIAAEIRTSATSSRVSDHDPHSDPRVKSETRNVTVGCRVGIRMTMNKSVRRSNAPQETATDCGYVGLQAIMSTVGLFANKYIAFNHEWNITGNYAVRMHKTLKQ